MTIEEIEEIPFLFIVAKGRSGTTLLQSILDANKHVALPIESKLILYLNRKYNRVENWSEKLIEGFLNDLYKNKKFAHYWKIDRKQLSDYINSFPISGISFQVLIKLIYLRYESPYPKDKILLIGDKNPRYSTFVAELINVFPKAKFIHLIRDYRASIASHIKTFNDGSASFQAHDWVFRNSMIQKEKQKNPSSFLTIKYEDLAENPETQIREICQFVNIPFDTNMLNFNAAIKTKAITDFKKEMKEVHPNLTEPINTKHIDKWRTILSPEQVEIINYIAGEYGKQFNYPISKKPQPSFKLRLKYFTGKIHQLFRFNIIKFYYNSPIIVRDLLAFLSRFSYKYFGHTNQFNRSDFRYKRGIK